MATEGWVGKSISIRCVEPAATVFQGTIKEVRPEVITIHRAFRNGVPVRKPDTEVKINSTNIASLELIPEATASDIGGVGVVTKPTPIKHPSLMLQQGQENGNNLNNLYQQQQSSQQPPQNSRQKTQQQQQQKQNNNNNNGFKDHSVSPHQSMNNNNANKKFFSNSNFPMPVPSQIQGGPVDLRYNNFAQPPTKPIDMPQGGGGAFNNNYNSQQRGNGGNGGNGNGKNGRRYQNSKMETFGTPVTDPTMEEDFDFEKNLALFDKQAVWEKINQMNSGKPDLLHHQAMGGHSGYHGNSRQQSQPKYRHDENILQSQPTQYRQIEVDYNSSRDYVSDDGLIVPSIPLIVRNRVQTAAEAMGLTWERQMDILSRGACDTALQLLGGGPRLKPNNKHQWPNIVVVCEEPYNDR